MWIVGSVARVELGRVVGRAAMVIEAESESDSLSLPLEEVQSSSFTSSWTCSWCFGIDVEDDVCVRNGNL